MSRRFAILPAHGVSHHAVLAVMPSDVEITSIRRPEARQYGLWPFPCPEGYASRSYGLRGRPPGSWHLLSEHPGAGRTRSPAILISQLPDSGRGSISVARGPATLGETQERHRRTFVLWKLGNDVLVRPERRRDLATSTELFSLVEQTHRPWILGIQCAIRGNERATQCATHDDDGEASMPSGWPMHEGLEYRHC